MIRVEQLVYGTFSFTQGFTLVSSSAGITAELGQQVVRVCKGWGEILNPDFRSALLHVPLVNEEGLPGGSGTGTVAFGDGGSALHLIGKVIRQGMDRGDRIAWYQQILVVSHRDFLRVGADFFAFEAAGFFKDRWFESDQTVTMEVDPSVLPRFDRAMISTEHIPVLEEMATALAVGKEVRVAAARATRSVAVAFREALSLLPIELRAGLSVATFAYRPVTQYDLWCLYESGGAAPEAVETIDCHIGRRPSADGIEGAAGRSAGSDVDCVALVAQALGMLREKRIADIDRLLDQSCDPTSQQT